MFITKLWGHRHFKTQTNWIQITEDIILCGKLLRISGFVIYGNKMLTKLIHHNGFFFLIMVHFAHIYICWDHPHHAGKHPFKHKTVGLGSESEVMLLMTDDRSDIKHFCFLVEQLYLWINQVQNAWKNYKIDLHEVGSRQNCPFKVVFFFTAFKSSIVFLEFSSFTHLNVTQQLSLRLCGSEAKQCSAGRDERPGLCLSGFINNHRVVQSLRCLNEEWRKWGVCGVRVLKKESKMWPVGNVSSQPAFWIWKQSGQDLQFVGRYLWSESPRDESEPWRRRDAAVRSL